MTTYTDALKERINQLEKRLCELEEKHRWHDAAEKSPKQAMIVIISCLDDIPRVVTYINGRYTDWQKIYHPEYWMELPELPKYDDDEANDYV